MKRNHFKEPARPNILLPSRFGSCRCRRPSQKRRAQNVNWVGGLTLENDDLLPQGDEVQSRSCWELKKAPKPERKTKRNRIMGPLQTAQSMRRRVLQVAGLRPSRILRTDTSYQQL
jgi:hypothetical protein